MGRRHRTLPLPTDKATISPSSARFAEHGRRLRKTSKIVPCCTSSTEGDAAWQRNELNIHAREPDSVAIAKTRPAPSATKSRPYATAGGNSSRDAPPAVQIFPNGGDAGAVG